MPNNTPIASISVTSFGLFFPASGLL